MSSRIVWPVLLLGGTLLLACTEATPNHCQNSGDCSGGKVCDVARAVCVSPDAAAAPMDGLNEPVGIVDASRVSDISVAIEVSVVIDAPYADAPYTTEVSVAADAPLSGEAGGTKLPVDAATIDVAVPDGYVPDAAGTCGTSGDCTDPSKAFCVAGVCVGCQTGLDGGANACMAPNPVCDSVSGRCVGCTADTHCSSTASPICNKTSNTCAACTLDAQCKSKNVALPACQADGRCVQCTSNASCGGATPVCDTTTNTCVQCTSAANCSDATPLCGSNNKCQACAGDGDCSALNDPARSACAASGACVQCTASNGAQCAGPTAVCNTATNKCVQCLASTSCSGATPICATATNTCRGCTAASDCVTLGLAGHLACGSSGACVQCTDNTTCSGVTPICTTSTNTCRACAADSECSAIGPGVCMSQSDGHCATDAETVYVQNKTGCSSSTSGGTAAAPFCVARIGVNSALTNSKPLVVLAGTLAAGFSVSAPGVLTIVGKSAIITPEAFTDGIAIASGEVYLRNLTVQGNAATGSTTNPGISAGVGVTLHMDKCAVTNNTGGGILLNGAAFQIENTIITGNGAGQTTGGLVWGGIRVDSLPASGPTVLNLVTVQNNNAVGISCSGNITGTGILATGNTSAEIANSCGFTSCTPALDGGSGCGAQ